MPDAIPTLEELNRSICEDEFYEFFLKAWHILEPVDALEDNWHIKYLCDTLQAEIERIARREPKDKDILINIPPRSLKSSIVTIVLNAWAWTKWPWMRFIATSYSADLAIEHAVKTRRIIDSPWYQSNWGSKFQLTDDQNTKGMFENTKGGFRKSVGVGGSVTGSGGDVIICDDPINPEDAHSQTVLATCIRWFRETLYSRLNNQSVGLRVIVMQRLHELDLTGWVLKKQAARWKHICMPVNDEAMISPEEIKPFYKDGLFFPLRFTQAVIQAARELLGSYGFSGQMKQSPIPDGGGIIKREWWKYYRERPAKIRRKIWSWDTAGKTNEINDYSVGQLWGVTDSGYCLLRLMRARLKYPELKRVVVQEYNAEPSDAVLIEDKSSGQAVIQDLKSTTLLPIIPVEPIKDKVTRAHLASPTIEAGKCYLPEDAPWVAAFVDECSVFPNGAFDDQVDCSTQFINYVASTHVISSSSLRTGAKLQTDGQF